MPIDGGTRQAIGALLEQTIDLAGTWYARQGVGVFVRNHVPTKVVTRPGPDDRFHKVRVATGSAIVDYSGHIVRYPDRSPGMREFVPVYFDVKGFSGAGHASYSHERDALHQIGFLQERQRDGVLAFLLLVDDTAGMAWVLERPKDLATLAGGGRVPVCERRGRLEFGQHFLPHVKRTPDGSRGQPPGYDFVPVLYRILSGDQWMGLTGTGPTVLSK